MDKKSYNNSKRNSKNIGRGRGVNHSSNGGTFSAALLGQGGQNSFNKQTSHNGPNKGSRGEERFQHACAKIQESVSRCINQNLDDLESSEEEELEENKILESVLNLYSDKGDDVNFEKTHQALIDSVKSGANVCLICIATVKRQDEVWSCKCCHSCFHLGCIQKWAKDSIYHQTSQLDDIQSSEASLFKWCCPKCRSEYKQLETPTHYYCYCGKVRHPKFDPWIVPHSCGQQCGKKLIPECGHICLLLCHPGPCPPCPTTVSSTCYCSQQKPITRRCSNRLWSCGKICNKLLSCKQHHCVQPCHKGDCLPCPKESIQKCICGKSSKTMPCSSPNWQCDKPCSKILDCVTHECEKICHKSEDCGKCPRSGSRSCPCGKTNIILPCTEDVNPCGDTCLKPLSCNEHLCSQRCHFGACGNCLQVIKKQCRCGLKIKSLPCHKDYTCETKCKKMRDCGRHACNKKCCVGQCPPCEQPCGRMLMCRNHKCSSRCHRGPCYPCQLSIDIKCNCGKTVITVPCGREKSTKPPRCRKPCMLKPDCHHPFRSPHRCHFGDCPPCTQICLQNLPNCDHTCPAACHTAVLMKIHDANQKRAGPWEPLPAPIMQVVKQPCPPCTTPMPVTCIGEHETHDFPCSEVRVYSCGRSCSRFLKCGNHSCTLECHDVKGSPLPDQAGTNCEECSQDCSKPRPDGCPHNCLKPCHPNDCPPCKQMIRVKCHCTLLQLYIPCDQYLSSKDSPETKEEMLSCKNQCPKDLPCKHRCQRNCHSGECTKASECSKKIVVRCPCKRIKKDIYCNQRSDKNNQLKCDDYCREKMEEAQRKLSETQKKMKQLEEQKQKEELLLYQHKLEGKKRKPRKVKEVVESESFIRNKSVWLFTSLSIAILSIFAYYLFSV